MNSHYPIISSWPSNRWIQERWESSTMDEIGKVEENENLNEIK
jgi:hypothetical protein